MSFPYQQFENLQIDPYMPQTRGQKRAAQSGRVGYSEHEEDQSSSPHPTTSPIFDDSGDAGMSDIRIRAKNTRDILSCFDDVTLPSNFHPEIYRSILENRTHRQCWTGNIEQTIFRLAVKDPHVYRSLSLARPPEARDVQFFQKMLSTIRETIQAFNAYTEDGTRSTLLPRIPTVGKLADQLLDFEDEIRTGLEERNTPRGIEVAADGLLQLLRAVGEMNRDAFENSARPIPPGETEDDRNLFVQIIGRPSIFVLDTMSRNISPSLLVDRHHDISRIRDEFRRHGPPRRYDELFNSILSSINDARGVDQESAAGQKRPAPASARGGKKRSK